VTRQFIVAIIVTVIAAAVPAMAADPDKLPALQADAGKVSVSGLSSGAFMAVQYDTAFSASVIGVGVVAGGPYNCAWVNFGGIVTCMDGSPLGSSSLDAATGFAALGQIDPVENLAKGKVYLFSGTKDTTVKQTAMNAVRDYYKLAGVPASHLLYVNHVPAGHAFLSPSFGGSCGTTASPYIDQCLVTGQLYDQPGAILTQIYGQLAPKATTLSSVPVAFDQTEFTSPTAGMASTGYVYIPAACQASGGAGCAVHVVFHGCKQGAGEVQDDVYSKLGYNPWADTNKIILLYPQVEPTTLPTNPEGCWDWWGYTGLDFQVQSGPQLSAIRAMVKRITGK
jgi:poly(3-hydroxybutyrate) depolymerase